LKFLLLPPWNQALSSPFNTSILTTYLREIVII
jgi:hypothetical protein